MYNSDRPINELKDDLLGRSSFSKQLGNAIINYRGNDGLVIGLFGKWGTGKTSAVNMTIDKIKSQNCMTGKILIMQFSPWYYSDQDNLIILFFEKLGQIINDGDIDNRGLKEKVGKALKDYSEAFELITMIPAVGSFISPIVKTAAKNVGEIMAKKADIVKLKNELVRTLVEYGEKIVVVIDDIDRLSNNQIRDIFQLVKQVADLPNIIYILVMDREIVTRALSEVHNCDGNEYLEKIIQIPYTLPELSKNKLNDIFFKKIEDLYKNQNIKITLDDDYWGRVLRNCIEPYVNTLRDVNRVINVLQFRVAFVRDEICVEDTIALTTMEVTLPDVFCWISQNRDALCGGTWFQLANYNKSEEEKKDCYTSAIKKLCPDDNNILLSIATIFPFFAKMVKERVYTSDYSLNDIKERRRVAEESRFDYFFQMDDGSILISRRDIDSFISEYDSQRLNKALTDYNDNGKLSYFLTELNSLIKCVSYERIGCICTALYNNLSHFLGETERTIFSVPNFIKAGYIAADLFGKLKTEMERYALLKDIIEDGDKFVLAAVSPLLLKIKQESDTNAGGQIIFPDHLKKIEEIYISKLPNKEFANDLVSLNNSCALFEMWKILDEEGADNYIVNYIKSPEGCLRYILSLTGSWSGPKGRGWTFSKQNYENYVSSEHVLELIDEFDKSELVKKFDDQELAKLASFVLNYNKTNGDRVYEQEAMQLVSQWKNNIQDNSLSKSID